jgi:hypothetical protein
LGGFFFALFQIKCEALVTIYFCSRSNQLPLWLPFKSVANVYVQLPINSVANVCRAGLRGSEKAPWGIRCKAHSEGKAETVGSSYVFEKTPRG